MGGTFDPCAPLLAKYFGKLAPISVGGATTMDTTLPIITRYSGESFIIGLKSSISLVFFSKNRQQVKMLKWDGDGFLLYQKRLERGTFELPFFDPKNKQCKMPYRTLSASGQTSSLHQPIS